MRATKQQGLPRTIDFRRDGVQVVDLPFGGISNVSFVGVCPLTSVRLYDCDTGNDPRGPLGVHACHEYVAREYSMEGPPLNVSWIAVNDDRSLYERGLAMAKTQWKAVAS